MRGEVAHQKPILEGIGSHRKGDCAALAGFVLGGEGRFTKPETLASGEQQRG